jgi:hypothetical protein
MDENPYKSPESLCVRDPDGIAGAKNRGGADRNTGEMNVSSRVKVVFGEHGPTSVAPWLMPSERSK